MSDKKVRHVLGLSGGKDSTALALYMKKKHPELEIEYFFSDTGAELEEVYEYLHELEKIIGPIHRLKSDSNFDDLLKIYGNYLPSVRQRWCTVQMKLKPFERFVGDDPVINYVGIRADEAHYREGYKDGKPNIEVVFPFIEDGLTKNDVKNILEASGIGLPKYYQWRSRSGCYFCFFQQKGEWVGLLDRHPDLYEKAAQYEKVNEVSGERYTWMQGTSLEEFKLQADKYRQAKAKDKDKHLSWQEQLKQQADTNAFDGDDDLWDRGCTICHL